jgi:hypothetical protein
MTRSIGSLLAWTPNNFVQALPAFVQTALPSLPPQVIALDGKTVRGSHDRFQGKTAIHMVSAWASASRLVLAEAQGGGQIQ